MKAGYVALVGSGPGEVSLLTLRAKELIENADVIVYDRLVSDSILQLIPNTTTKINVGKQSSNHLVPQEEINKILLTEAINGNNVVRLKGGDPFVFGRGGEELDLLVKNNIKFEVVPGITSAISAPSFAGIPVTHRDFCSSFHIITGHQKKNEPLNINFKSLVDTKGTLIFLMGVSSLKDISDGLMKAGMDIDMPAALIENGTRSNQRKVISTLENIYLDATKQNFKSPSIIIVGKVCSLSNDFDWFSKRPLFNKHIIVTSPTSSTSKLKDKLTNLGANVTYLPAIRIEKLDITEALNKEIANLTKYTWLVFTSKNGVNIFFEQLSKMNNDTRYLNNIKVAAIGPSTSEELKKHGIIADYVPNKYQTETLASGLINLVTKHDNVLFLRAQKGNEDLVNKFIDKKINYTDLKIYQTKALVNYKSEIEDLTKQQIYITFTSASCVDSFMKNNPNVKNIIGICIGSQTAKSANKYNIKHYVSDIATIDSMIEKIIEVTK